MSLITDSNSEFSELDQKGAEKRVSLYLQFACLPLLLFPLYTRRW